jgi:hypothetical protein
MNAQKAHEIRKIESRETNESNSSGKNPEIKTIMKEMKLQTMLNTL